MRWHFDKKLLVCVQLKKGSDWVNDLFQVNYSFKDWMWHSGRFMFWNTSIQLNCFRSFKALLTRVQFRVQTTVRADTHHPELDEVLKHCRCYEHTVQHRVRQEKQEELVVGEADTIVHPEETTYTHVTFQMDQNKIREFITNWWFTMDSDDPFSKHIYRTQEHNQVTWFNSN